MSASSSASRIEPHHEAAARSWGHGGRAYDDISFVLSDALAHAAQRLDAAAGQEILDVATGTGWSARNAARRGARVTGVDIAPELLAAAAALSAHVEPAITFEHGDAERLPFRIAGSTASSPRSASCSRSGRSAPPPSWRACAGLVAGSSSPRGRRPARWPSSSASSPATRRRRRRPLSPCSGAIRPTRSGCSRATSGSRSSRGSIRPITRARTTSGSGTRGASVRSASWPDASMRPRWPRSGRTSRPITLTTGRTSASACVASTC